ncbi:UDP-N-acetylmuramoyl-tripeptide--D-alanyl-D-alanine ligase [Candidatus Uhrbacteria bacterium]|nr:UDP-N-acetylmuramoyl-tripeptide--D-alanyl-D-alanine ligase [Candidatus Uhrbacteria bacterium]
MRSIVQSILSFFARRILAKYKPVVIGITGSVGKTSTKDAIVAVLRAGNIAVRGSSGNYNNEFGVPLTIIGALSGKRSLWGWIRVCARAKRLWFFRDRAYPKVLVLEMGADHSGDIRYLTALAQPTIAVVTAVSPAHVESLGSLDRIAREKSALVSAISRDGVAVLNGDDDAVRAMRDRAKGRVVTYGLGDGNDIRAVEIQLSAHVEDGQTKVDGITFKLTQNGSAVPVRIPGVAGLPAVSAALAAAAVGLEQGLHLVEIAFALASYIPPPGRMRVIDGIKYTTILDDTYNASPRATEAALATLADLPRGEQVAKWAVLGDMLELGTMAEGLHHDVGKRVADLRIDHLVTVGELSRDIDRGAREAGMAEERIFHFAYAAEAGRFVQSRMKQGDILLIKGSQGVRMEKIVKELMAEPERAKELLVRQDASWV